MAKKRNYIVKFSSSKQQKHAVSYYNTQKIENASAENIISADLKEAIAAAEHLIELDTATNVLIIIFLGLSFISYYLLFAALVFVCAKIYIKTVGRINLHYEFDAEAQQEMLAELEKYRDIANSERLWRVMKTSSVSNERYNAGVSQTSFLRDCSSFFEAPFPFKTNISPVCFKSGQEQLIFFPDFLIIAQKKTLGAIKYSDITEKIYTVRFSEENTVPRDTTVVDYVWKYATKTGSQDKRFTNNKKLPVCLYGKLYLMSESGLNTIIMFSKTDTAKKYSKANS